MQAGSKLRFWQALDAGWKRTSPYRFKYVPGAITVPDIQNVDAVPEPEVPARGTHIITRQRSNGHGGGGADLRLFARRHRRHGKLRRWTVTRALP